MAKIKTAKKSDNKFLRVTPNIVILLIIGFLARIILSPFGTLALDQNTFIAWSNRLIEVGMAKFYFKGWSDYLPGYLYVLSILGQINKLNIIPPTILFKLPAILTDLATTLIIYKIVKSLKKEKESLARISAILYLFNPAILANSSLWGQVDGLTAFFSLISVWSLSFNPYLSAISLAIGTLIKPQMAVISLIIVLLMTNKKFSFTKTIAYIITSASIFVLGFLPFAAGNNIFNFIFSRLNLSLNQYPYTSVNAFNFWAITGSWRPDMGLNI